MNLPGTPLTANDLERLAESGIDRGLAERAQLRRVDSPTGSQIVGRNGGADYSGLLIPYIWPGEEGQREYRLRRDHPEMEQAEGGRLREKNKYLSPPGRGGKLYLPPDVDPEWLSDASLPIVVTEGEKKALASWGLAWHGLGDSADLPRCLPIAISGAWNFRGITGKTSGPDGDRRDVKGVIPDFDRIVWSGRTVTIIFDANVYSNDSVRAARATLAAELRKRGAHVLFADIPPDAGVNGIDDLIGAWGKDRVLELITHAYDPKPAVQIHALTELGNAERFRDQHGEDVRHCSGAFLYYAGECWREDKTGEIVRLMIKTVRSIHKEQSVITRLRADLQNELATATGERRTAIVDKLENLEEIGDSLNAWARKSEKGAAIKAAIELAKSLEPIALSEDELDRDGWLFNCLNGTINLHTGRLLAHTREHYITKISAIRYDPAAMCERWLGFLDQVFESDQARIDFLQRAVGYSLTADVREECLFLLHGHGRNGKGTLLLILAALLGDYATTADFNTFVESRNTGPRDDIAHMRGRRFVQAQESKEGCRLDESLVKWLTGGDLLRARRLYENSYEFRPTHKLWLAANHLPIIRGTDPAIWSRIKLVPFEVSFLGREDRGLKQALLDELPGILAWAVRGCLLWQRDSLKFPESVIAATDEYRAESDDIGRFIAQRCEIGENFSARARALYTEYIGWCQENGERHVSGKRFSQRMSENGIEKKEDKHGTLYIGLRFDNNQPVAGGE
jgi:putative DNA primase/helicase